MPAQEVVYLPFEALHGAHWNLVYQKGLEETGQDSVLVNPGHEFPGSPDVSTVERV